MMPLDIIGQADHKQRAYIWVLVDQKTRSVNLFQSISNGKVINHKMDGPMKKAHRTTHVGRLKSSPSSLGFVQATYIDLFADKEKTNELQENKHLPEEPPNLPLSQPRNIDVTGHARLEVHSGHIVSVQIMH
jgi:hypothetical protein